MSGTMGAPWTYKKGTAITDRPANQKRVMAGSARVTENGINLVRDLLHCTERTAIKAIAIAGDYNQPNEFRRRVRRWKRRGIPCGRARTRFIGSVMRIERHWHPERYYECKKDKRFYL